MIYTSGPQLIPLLPLNLVRLMRKLSLVVMGLHSANDDLLKVPRTGRKRKGSLWYFLLPSSVVKASEVRPRSVCPSMCSSGSRRATNPYMAPLGKVVRRWNCIWKIFHQLLEKGLSTLPQRGEVTRSKLKNRGDQAFAVAAPILCNILHI